MRPRRLVPRGARVPAAYVTLAIAFSSIVPAASVAPFEQPRRIVSLVPALTEMLFAMGAGPQVIAVSSYDQDPPEVRQLPRVGALLDPDVERILALRPDLVLVYGSQSDLMAQLTRAAIPYFSYRHGGVSGVVATMRTLGAAAGHAQSAERAAVEIERRLQALQRETRAGPRPKTMLVFSRERGSLRHIHASGGRGFLHDLLEAAGGQNVFAGVALESVQVSTEMILVQKPDVILEIRADDTTIPDVAAERAVWNAVGSVPAVRQDRVHVLTGRHLVVPGPRIAEAAEAFARVLGRH